MSKIGTTQAQDGQGDTIGRMFAAAEVLFAEKGQDKVSLRELTKLAGVNVAAVSYHFGSKEGLAKALFERLSVKINKERIVELERYLEDTRRKGERADIRSLIAIFLDPYVGPGNERQGMLLARMMMQHRIFPSAQANKLIQKYFDPWAKRFIEALILACPNVDPNEMYWRYLFMTNAVTMTLTDRSKSSRIARLSAGEVDTTNVHELRRALLHFLAGALSIDSR